MKLLTITVVVLLKRCATLLCGVQVSEFKNRLKAAASSLHLSMSDAPPQQLPPASLQTFMKECPNISGLVITNHQKEFTNQYVLYVAVVVFSLYCCF